MQESLKPGSGRSPGEGNGYPLQYSCQKNSMDRGAWQATVPGVSESYMTEWLILYIYNTITGTPTSWFNCFPKAPPAKIMTLEFKISAYRFQRYTFSSQQIACYFLRGRTPESELWVTQTHKGFTMGLEPVEQPLKDWLVRTRENQDIRSQRSLKV